MMKNKDESMLSILDSPLIGERYFFPRGAALPDPTWVEAGSTRLACYSTAPHDGAPTLLHFHGNGEVVADYVPHWTESLVDAGFNVFLAEYRGYGGSSGIPALVQMLGDVEPIFDAVGCPPEQMVVYGRSVGSIYAIELVHRHPEIGRLVIESGIAEPLERILLRIDPEELGTTHAQLADEVARFLDHEKKLAGYRNPTLVMHARHDNVVSARHATLLAKWSAGPTFLRLFEQGDHNSIVALNSTELLDTLRRFANDRLIDGSVDG